MSRKNGLRWWLGGVLAGLTAQAGLAQSFQAPPEMIYGGRIYRQAVKQERGDGSLYEYTTGGEPIDNWTRLVGLYYKPGLAVTPADWVKVLKQSMDSKQPRPDYVLSVKGGNSYAQIIYKPDGNYAGYESDVFKTFHLPDCGGMVTLQVAVKYPQETPPLDAGPKDFANQQLKQIALKNSSMLAAIEAYAWTPKCGKTPG